LAGIFYALTKIDGMSESISVDLSNF